MYNKSIILLSLFATITVSLVAQTRTLDYYIQQGVANSPLLKDYTNQIRSSQVDSMVIGANQKPQVSAIGQVVYAPVYNGYGYNQQATNGGTYLGEFNVSKLIANRKYANAQYEAINIQIQSTGNTAKISEHDLKKSITDQYLIVYQDKKQIEASEPVIDLLSKEIELLKQLTSNGIYKQTDLLSFTIEFQTQQITLNQLKSQYRTDIYALNNLCGITDTTSVSIATPDISKHISYFLENIPQFIKFHIDSLTIINSKKMVDLNYRPQINAFANAGLDAVQLQGMQQNFGFSVGLNFNLPIYDGNQRKLGYKKLEYSEDTRKTYRDFLSTQYKIQIQQIEEDLKANAGIKQQLNKQKSDIQILIEMNKQQLNTGAISITDYTINLRRLLDLQNDLNAAEIKELLLINSYNYLVW